jgi:monofunctional biosynthetic peptidoglycan transglycosylase
LEAIKKARKHNETHKRKRGASTISQQTAKNVFLWPGRTWVRKGLEVYFTVLIEVFWSKERIMEVYLNVIETGDGIYGTDAAARIYFNKSAAKLSRAEAALITAALPNPRKRNPGKPSAYLSARKNLILRNMNNIGKVEFD